MDVTHFAVISHVNLSHIVQCILVYWFPPRLDMNSVNGGLERAAPAPKTLLLRDAWLSPHRPTPEVWQKHVQMLRSSLRVSGWATSFISVWEEERDIVYLPCSHNKNPVGVWKSNTLHANYFILSGTLCCTMKENSRIKKYVFSWTVGWFCAPFKVQLCAVFPACASVSFSEGEMRPVIRLGEGTVSLLSHIFPSQRDWPPASPRQTHLQILKDYAGQRLERLWQVTETWTTIWAGIYLILVSRCVPLSHSSGRTCLYASVRVRQVYFGWCVFGFSSLRRLRSQPGCCLNSAVFPSLVCPAENAAVSSKWQLKKPWKWELSSLRRELWCDLLGVRTYSQPTEINGHKMQGITGRRWNQICFFP